MYFPLLVGLQQQQGRPERVLAASGLFCSQRACQAPAKYAPKLCWSGDWDILRAGYPQHRGVWSQACAG